ncbi:hypothetical protein AAC387_Pa03g2991 [Persea americana]
MGVSVNSLSTAAAGTDGNRIESKSKLERIETTQSRDLDVWWSPPSDKMRDGDMHRCASDAYLRWLSFSVCLSFFALSLFSRFPVFRLLLAFPFPSFIHGLSLWSLESFEYF